MELLTVRVGTGLPIELGLAMDGASMAVVAVPLRLPGAAGKVGIVTGTPLFDGAEGWLVSPLSTVDAV